MRHARLGSAFIFLAIYCGVFSSHAQAYPLLQFLKESAVPVESKKDSEEPPFQGLEATLESIFGTTSSSLQIEDWPYNVPGYTTEIKKIRYNRPAHEVEFHLSLINPITHHAITEDEGWVQVWSREEPKQDVTVITKDLWTVSSRHKTVDKIAKIIVENQLSFLKKYAPSTGKLMLDTSNIGNYVWATRGFRFFEPMVWDDAEKAERNSTLTAFREYLLEFARAEQLPLRKEDLVLFKEPYHFAALTNGRPYIIDSPREVTLTEEQLKSGLLGVFSEPVPLTREEFTSGLTRRISGHLGKKFLLAHYSWSGEISVDQWHEGSESYRFAQSQADHKENAYQTLSEPYRALIERLKKHECDRRLSEGD